MWLGVSVTTALVIGCATGPTPPVLSSPGKVLVPVVRAPIRAIHGGPIAVLAVTTQGDAAITADDAGAFRLWPSFDGREEPIVVVGQQPRGLAIAHDGDGFAFAILDRVGMVEIVRVGRDGTPRSRATLSAAAISVTATSRGFVALGEDRALAITDLAGRSLARLAPEPGVRVEAIVARGDQVLALASSASDGVRGRWIDLAHATWGASTPKLASIVPVGAVLTPDAANLIGKAPTVTNPNGDALTQTMTVSLATGGAAHLAICETGPLLGFVDGKTLACFDGDRVAWWVGTTRVLSTAVVNGTTDTVGLGGGLVVAGYQTQLALVTPMGSDYLGYDVADLPRVRFTSAGIVFGLGDAGAHVIDRDFAAKPEVSLPPTPYTWLDVVPLDARYTLTLSTTAVGDKAIAIYDTEDKRLGPALAFVGREERLQFEPSTGLLLGADEHGETMQAIDPVTRAIGAPRALAAPIAFLVDPALADDVAVIAATPSRRGLDVVEVSRTGEPKHRYHVGGELRAVDRAGRIYLAIDGEPGDVDVVVHGEAGVTLVGVAAQLVRPSPDGALIATISATTLTVRDRAGVVRWASPAIGARELGWQGDGLVAQFATGFVRYELATGAEVAAKCGWGFGRFETPRTATPQEGVVCD